MTSSSKVFQNQIKNHVIIDLKRISVPKDYNSLSPTLGDFLIDLNKKNNDKKKDLLKQQFLKQVQI